MLVFTLKTVLFSHIRHSSFLVFPLEIEVPGMLPPYPLGTSQEQGHSFDLQVKADLGKLSSAHRLWSSSMQ